ncbi:hypothetical protein RRF57_006245 [Xylaria bambusicola]|uniref:PPC89 centrosome localisation domain-containing protein n=1 Tax=Xylaria bambusicola TaxID=326684 RepID=A0AAN7YYK8_9PEZI
MFNSSIFGSNSPRLRVPHQAPIAEVEETMELPPLHPTSGNLTKLLNTLQTARSEKVQTEQESVKRSSQISPKSQPNTGFSADAVRRPKRQPQLNIHSTSSPSILNQTAHSFFLPQFSHLDDFLTGTLRWSSFKNGTPIFVKHGRVHDRVTKRSPDHHADFEDVNIPKEEEEIFVSLDKIREEIQILQEHDEHVSKQAEQLQSEVAELQDHIARLKSRKDSAMGSDSDSSMIMQLTTQKSQLAEKLASLRAELDQANRRIGSNEIHNQSIVAERDRLLHQTSDIIRERDNLRDQVSKHEITIDRLQNRNDALTREKLALEQDLQGAEEAFNSLHQQYARSELLVKDLKDDNLRVERQYEGLYNSNQHLQQENAELEQRGYKVAESCGRVKQELSQKMDTQYAQQIQGAVPSLSKEKLTKMTHNWESSDRFTVVSETSAKATTSRMHRMHLLTATATLGDQSDKRFSSIIARI